MNKLLGLALVASLLSLHCGDSDGTSADGKSAESTPKAEATRYQRPRLEPWALTATLYYPLDTCIVSGKPLSLISHNEVIEGHLFRTYNEAACGEIKKAPAKYIQQLEEAYKIQQRKTYPLTTCIVTGEPLGENPHDVLLDPRDKITQMLDIDQEYRKYRYTVAWRLLRFANPEAEQKFRHIEVHVVNAEKGLTTEKIPTAGAAMDKLYAAFDAAQRPAFLKQSMKCVVNKRDLGRDFEDPETGGFRVFLLHDREFIVCCKTCMDQMDKNFFHQADAIAETTTHSKK